MNEILSDIDDIFSFFFKPTGEILFNIGLLTAQQNTSGVISKIIFLKQLDHQDFGV